MVHIHDDLPSRLPLSPDGLAWVLQIAQPRRVRLEMP